MIVLRVQSDDLPTDNRTMADNGQSFSLPSVQRLAFLARNMQDLNSKELVPKASFVNDNQSR